MGFNRESDFVENGYTVVPEDQTVYFEIYYQNSLLFFMIK